VRLAELVWNSSGISSPDVAALGAAVLTAGGSCTVLDSRADRRWR
jgi:hypothetical protein